MGDSMKHIVLIIFIIFIVPQVVLAGNFTKYKNVRQYDIYFHKYSKRYFGPAFDWIHMKSQAIAESNLNDNAKSAVGAKGLMQVMPKTYEEIVRHNKEIKGSVYQPEWNIAAGIWYDRDIWKQWSPKKTFQDSLDFMFSSYNAGRGHIINAQRKCNGDNYDPNSWACIEANLVQITGRHSKETLGYVKRIKEITRDIK